MKNQSAEVATNIEIPTGYSIAFTPVKKETVKCEICGAENEAERELCRVCSNYLRDEESNK